MSLLSHLKVLDFSTLLPGPYATMMLADMGAEVLRVESTRQIDFLRFAAPMDGDQSANHMYLNRSKKLLAVDLKQQDGVDIIKQLIREQDYDIVVEQFRPGVMKRLGIDYDTLREINPGIIYCSITGYGQTGPYKDRAGHDNNYLSLAGVADYSRRVGEPPVPQGIQIADIAGGSMHAVAGILAAVSHREQTGNGQHIDVSMTDAAFALNALAAPGLLACGEPQKAETTLLNGGTFYDYYETSDGRFFGGQYRTPVFKALTEATGTSALMELYPTMMQADTPERRKAQKQIKQTLRDAFASQTFEHWQAVFAATDACVEPVLNLAESKDHPQLTARNMVITVPKPDGSQQPQVAHPIKYSNYSPDYKYTGGAIGEDTRHILQELGYTESRIDELKEHAVIKEAE
ncbi:MAG: CaiB/BaiF CoA-transferase family protein [Porticoccaceae bacterium]